MKTKYWNLQNEGADGYRRPQTPAGAPEWQRLVSERDRLLDRLAHVPADEFAVANAAYEAANEAAEAAMKAAGL